MRKPTLKNRILCLLLGAVLCIAAGFMAGCVEGPGVNDASETGSVRPAGESDSGSETGSGNETWSESHEELETMTPVIESDPVEAGNCSDLMTDSRSFAVVDDDGALFIGKNMYKAYRPASITKVVTALVTVESVSLDNKVVIPEAAVAEGVGIMSSGVRPSFKPGETVTVRDLLYALILPSTNSAGNILACHVAGSVPDFVEMMNDKMTELGLTHSHFANPHGMDAEGHYSCAYDMAVVLSAACQNPALKTILGAHSYAIPATEYTGIRSMNNTHAILSGAEPSTGAFAGKTGYTNGAKSTLLTAFERNGKRFYVCTMNSDEGLAPLDTKNVADYAYARYNGTLTSLEAFPHELTVVAEDANGLTVRYSTELNAVSARVVFWDLKTGTSTAVFVNNTPVGRNAECRITPPKKGSYAIQVFAQSASGKERPIQTAFLFDGQVNAEGLGTWNGQTFIFDSLGMLRTGAIETWDGCYYANADGGIGKGFIGQFYAGADYKIISGWFTAGGQTFYAQADGRLAKGKLIVDGVLHTFGDNGLLID